jgi:hypothetical protein
LLLLHSAGMDEQCLKRHESRAGAKFAPRKHCFHFAKGLCAKGDQCTFLHVVCELAACADPTCAKRHESRVDLRMGVRRDSSPPPLLSSVPPPLPSVPTLPPPVGGPAGGKPGTPAPAGTHPSPDERVVGMGAKFVPRKHCFNFAKGLCSKGEQCTFLHVVCELAACADPTCAKRHESHVDLRMGVRRDSSPPPLPPPVGGPAGGKPASGTPPPRVGSPPPPDDRKVSTPPPREVPLAEFVASVADSQVDRILAVSEAETLLLEQMLQPRFADPAAILFDAAARALADEERLAAQSKLHEFDDRRKQFKHSVAIACQQVEV